MILHAVKKHWQHLAVLLGIAGIGIAAYMQIKSTGEVSLAQSATMRSAIASSVRQFEQGIARELTYLLAMFEPESRVARSGPGPWARYADSRSRWRRTSAHAEILDQVLAASVTDDGARFLYKLPGGEGRQRVEATWGESLAPVKEVIESGVIEDAQRELRGPVWFLVPSATAVVRTVSAFERLRPVRPGYLILVLDWSYAIDTLLPRLAERSFATPDGERQYEVAISLRPSGDFVYRSSDSIDLVWVEAADIRRRMSLTGASPQRDLGPAEFQRRFAAGRRMGGRPREGERPEIFGGRPLNLGRARVFAAGAGTPWDLEIAASHVDGPIAGIVGWQRTQSLAAGLGALAALGVAMILLVVSARRASHLARMQLEFIAGITHELRTPLSVICSVGENLADGVVGAREQARRYGELIRDQGRRLTETVEQTLHFAALKSGKRRFQLEPLDAATVVRTALDQARPMIEKAGFCVEHEEAVDLPPVRADVKAVQQILSNLLSNAVKYGEPGRWIRVETTTGKRGEVSQVEIRVRDRGVGIPAKESRRVFDEFYRGSAAAEKSIHGSGLGLKLARDLALGMNGKLSLASRLGKGSVFTLTLPAARGAAS